MHADVRVHLINLTILKGDSRPVSGLTTIRPCDPGQAICSFPERDIGIIEPGAHYQQQNAEIAGLGIP